MLNEQSVAHIANTSWSTMRAGRDCFAEAVWAEDLSAVPTVVLALLSEAVLAAVALVNVVLVLPSNLEC
jgi:hypothetical protein